MTRLELEADLQGALERGELFLVNQPEVDLRTGKTVALEALVRWKHPVRGRVPPDDFVQIAEETGQMIPIGQWVMAEACRQMRRWRQAGVDADEIVLAINLTGRELRQEGLDDHIAGCLRAADLAPAQVCLEVSERILTDDVLAVTSVLHALRDLGVQIAIDDFGAGYTSITSWPQLSASTLKLDRSLTGRLGSAGNGFPFVQAFTTLAHTLHMRVCAEGVETRTQLDQVRAAPLRERRAGISGEGVNDDRSASTRRRPLRDRANTTKPGEPGWAACAHRRLEHRNRTATRRGLDP